MRGAPCPEVALPESKGVMEGRGRARQSGHPGGFSAPGASASPPQGWLWVTDPPADYFSTLAFLGLSVLCTHSPSLCPRPHTTPCIAP